MRMSASRGSLQLVTSTVLENLCVCIICLGHLKDGPKKRTGYFVTKHFLNVPRQTFLLALPYLIPEAKVPLLFELQ